MTLISLFRTELFQRLSIQVGTTAIFVVCVGSISPNLIFNAMRTVKASRVDVIKEGFPPFSKNQGQAASEISTANQHDRPTSGTTWISRVGYHPPSPVHRWPVSLLESSWLMST